MTVEGDKTPAATLEERVGMVLVVAAILWFVLHLMLLGLLGPEGPVPVSARFRVDGAGTDPMVVQRAALRGIMAIVLVGVAVLLVCGSHLREGLGKGMPPARLSAPWGGMECFKVAACFFLTTQILGPLGRLTGSLDGLYLVGYCMFLVTGLYALWMLEARGVTPQSLWGAVPGGRAFRLGVLCTYGFFPLFFLLVVFNGLLVPFLKEIFGYQPDPVQMQSGLQYLLNEGTARPYKVVFVAYAVVGAPLTEELFFRGILYGALRRTLRWVPAMILSGALFGLMHGWTMAIPLGAFGILLGGLREYTGSLVVCAVAHGVFNGTMLCLLFYGVLQN